MRRLLLLFLPAIPLLCLASLLVMLFISPEFSSTKLARDYEKPFLVFTTGLVTLAASYLTTILQSFLQREKERQRARRDRAQKYREYLENVLWLCQQYDIFVYRYPELYNKARRGKNDLQAQLQRIILEMPPAWDLSAIPEQKAKEAVDRAIDAAMRLLTDISQGKQPNYQELREAYIKALDALDRFELG